MYPLRFISEALGKKVEWDEENETIWIGNNPNHVVATYKGGTVTKGEFDAFFNFKALFNSTHAPPKITRSTKQVYLRELVTNRILYSRASEADQERCKDKCCCTGRCLEQPIWRREIQSGFEKGQCHRS